MPLRTDHRDGVQFVIMIVSVLVPELSTVIWAGRIVKGDLYGASIVRFGAYGTDNSSLLSREKKNLLVPVHILSPHGGAA